MDWMGINSSWYSRFRYRKRKYHCAISANQYLLWPFCLLSLHTFSCIYCLQFCMDLNSYIITCILENFCFFRQYQAPFCILNLKSLLFNILIALTIYTKNNPLTFTEFVAVYNYFFFSLLTHEGRRHKINI